MGNETQPCRECGTDVETNRENPLCLMCDKKRKAQRRNSQDLQDYKEQRARYRVINNVDKNGNPF